jgi:hypothetical protein
MAVFLVVLSIIVNFLWLPVYPIWSLVIIVIDVFVLYAVIVHGRELKQFLIACGPAGLCGIRRGAAGLRLR